MTAKILVLFGKPTDPVLFDKQYWEEHVPMARKMPGLKKFTVNRVVPPPGREAPYYQVVEMEFENMEALKKATKSPQSQESTQHASKMATGGMTFLYVESKEAA
jgi:uncharacterized protein (TIGR02118 family)